MARERRLPSIRSSAFASEKQAKTPAETQTRDHDDKPAIEKDDVSRTAASSTSGDGRNKHDERDDGEPQQNSSAEVLQDTRTFQQLVHDYGNDILSLNELFHAQPCESEVEAMAETTKGE